MDPYPLPRIVAPRPHHRTVRRGDDRLQLGVELGRAVEVSGLSEPLLRLLLEIRGPLRVNELVRRAVDAGASESEARTLLADLYADELLVDAGGLETVRLGRRRGAVLVDGGGPVVGLVADALRAAGVGATHGDPGSRYDLAVLVDPAGPDGELPAALVSRGVPHLAVRLSDGIGVIGPLVLPRRSACLRCVYLHRAVADPHWPKVAAQLAGSVGSASPSCTTATAALAAEQALLALDAVVGAGEAPPTVDGTLELDVRRGVLRRRRWPPRPDCDCGAERER